MLMDNIHIIDVTADNVYEVGVYCIKNKKAPGYKKKLEWFKNKLNHGLKIKIVSDHQGKHHGFIEYIHSEQAWRPIKAQNYYFIQCIALFGKALRNRKIGSTLLEQCEEEARKSGKEGLCTMSSDGPWMANKKLFLKNGFGIAQKLGRFELMYKPFHHHSPAPQFHDWTVEQQKYKGWNLIYSDQCPWHDKAVNVITQSAEKSGINLKVTRLETPEMAQKAPSGFGTFTLINDGKVLADHYISKTRFENILKEVR